MELMEEEEEEEEEVREEEDMDDDEDKAPKDRDIKESASAADDDEDMDILLGDGAINTPTNDDYAGGSSADVDLAISRAEHLTSRRPLLLNRVLLRQNPHNVGEWIKRSKLYLDLDEIDLAASALEESLKAVSSRKSVNGSPCALVLTLVDVHENRRGDVDSARRVLERICAPRVVGGAGIAAGELGRGVELGASRRVRQGREQGLQGRQGTAEEPASLEPAVRFGGVVGHRPDHQ